MLDIQSDSLPHDSVVMKGFGSFAVTTSCSGSLVSSPPPLSLLLSLLLLGEVGNDGNDNVGGAEAIDDEAAGRGSGRVYSNADALAPIDEISITSLLDVAVSWCRRSDMSRTKQPTTTNNKKETTTRLEQIPNIRHLPFLAFSQHNTTQHNTTTTQHNTTHLDSMTSGDTSCSVRLFVGGVSTCGEELLKQRFSSFGTVQDVELVAGKPFAYVTLAAPDISQRVSRCM
jgi:hypothetical protein